MATGSSEARKCVVVGDHAIGKTHLIQAATTQMPPAMIEYVPTSRSTAHPTTVMVNERSVRVDLWDTPSRELFNFDRFKCEAEIERGLADASLVVMCFSVCDPTSFKIVKSEWMPRIQRQCPGVDVFLVATKSDFRHDDEIRRLLFDRLQAYPVTLDEGRQLAHEIGAEEYIECSAIVQEQVHELMQRLALKLQ